MLRIQCIVENQFFCTQFLYAYWSMEAAMAPVGVHRIKKPEGIEDGVWVKAGTSFEVSESHYLEGAYQPSIGDLPWGVSPSEEPMPSPYASWAEPSPEWASRLGRQS
jgi:hypothetical protein